MKQLEHPAAAPETGRASNLRSARILDAASRCFSQKGFQNTTIIDVADAAGVSRPLVYKYFGGKDGLIDSLLQSTFSDWKILNDHDFSTDGFVADGAAADTRGAARNGGTAAHALEEKFESAIDFVRLRPIFRSILQQDPQIILRGYLEGLRGCRAVSAESTRAVLHAGVATGEFRGDLDLEATTASLEMILFGLLERALGIRPELSLEPSLTRSTIDLLLAGLLSKESRS